MGEVDKIHVCDICGNEVRVTKSLAGRLVFCDTLMHVTRP